jgi:hypothetical protein
MDHGCVSPAFFFSQDPEHQLQCAMRDYSRFAGDMWSNTEHCWPRRWCTQPLCDAKVAALLKSATESAVPNVCLLSTLANAKRGGAGQGSGVEANLEVNILLVRLNPFVVSSRSIGRKQN